MSQISRRSLIGAFASAGLAAMSSPMALAQAGGAGEGRAAARAFASRKQAANAIARGWQPEPGQLVWIGALGFLGQAGTTAIVDLPGLVPAPETVRPEHWADNTRPGKTPMAAAISAAIAYLSGEGGGVLWLSANAYRLETSIIGADNVALKGPGRNLCRFVRGDDFGSSFVQKDGDVQIEGISFEHGTYVPQFGKDFGDQRLDGRLTDGSAHLDLTSCRSVTVSDCRFWRMPYGVKLDGCHNVLIQTSEFAGTWHPKQATLQEGLASLWLGGARTDYNQIVRIRGNRCTGSVGPDTVVSYSNGVSARDWGGGGGRKKEQNWGPRNQILVNNCEMLTVSENYINRASAGLVKVDLLDSWPCYGLRFIGNEFDAGTGQPDEDSNTHVDIFDRVADRQIRQISFAANLFAGTSKTVHALRVRCRVQAPDEPTAFGLSVTGNQFLGYVGTPLLLEGVEGFQITGNTITGFNWQGFGPENPRYVSGIWIGRNASRGTINGNTIGGGATDMSAKGALGFYGVYLENPEDASVVVGDNAWGPLAEGGAPTNWAYERDIEGKTGWFRRAIDGRLDCWGEVTLQPGGGAALVADWAFPSPFADRPMVQAQAMAGDLDRLGRADSVGPVLVDVPDGARARLQLSRLRGTADWRKGDAVRVQARATGRWRA